MKKLSGAEIIVQAIRDQGVKFVFGYPGGSVLDIYDAIQTHGGIEQSGFASIGRPHERHPSATVLQVGHYISWPKIRPTLRAKRRRIFLDTY